MSENAMIRQEQEMVSISIPQNTAVNVWQDKEAFDQAARVANMLSKSKIVPEAYQNRPEDCFIAVELAARMNTSPVFIMQNLYVVKGKPSWAGQACMAMITACGKFKSVRHVYTGTKGTENRGCYVEAIRISDGELIQGTEVTIKMAKDEGWMSNSKWKNMPEQMLGYRAASFFARMYCPEAMMGLQTTEEIYDASPVESKPAENLAAAIQAEEAEPDKKSSSKKSAKKTTLKCEDCGKEISGVDKFSAEQIAAGSKQKYGKALCMECAQKRKAEVEAAEKASALEAATQETVEPADDLAAPLMADAEE
jgi:hypothetical protein